MGSRCFGGGNGRRGEFERSIEGKRGRCTKCKGDGSYLIPVLVRVTELGVIKIPIPGQKDPVPSQLVWISSEPWL
jgi:hypothetical protein